MMRTRISTGYRPHSFQARIHRDIKRFSVLVCHRRFGKALDVATPVPMADGSWKTMGKLKAGDMIFGSDGAPVRVLMAHPVMFNRECYEVEFASGEVIVADAEHLWVTTRKKDRHNPVRTAEGRVNMPRPAEPRTTKDIYNSLRSRGEFNHRIQIHSAVQYPARLLPFDPYLLGVWLGDGTARLAEATTYRVNGGVQARLRELGVLGDKHIPVAFLTADITQRKALLRGIMDADGCINAKGNYCEIVQRSKRLADDIERLLLSLGMHPRTDEKVVKGRVYYRIGFRPSFNCFTVPRHRDRYTPAPDCKGWQSIIRVEPVASRPVRCITVDAPDSLYLVGRKFTVTHNTILAVNTLIDAAARSKAVDPHFAYVAPQYNQAKSVAWNYLVRFASAVPGVVVNKSELSITYRHNNAKVRLFGANNPDSLRGLYFDGIVLDEVADMKPEVWGEVVRPALADRKGWALFIGTPKGYDMFYDLYTHALNDPKWYAGLITVEDTVDDPGVLIDREELELAKSSMTENQFRQEFMCDFTASCENTLITIDVVNAAAGRYVHAPDYSEAPRIIGVDVARFGDDRSCIVKRQGLAVFEPLIYKGVDNMWLAGQVSREIDDFEPDAVFVDAGRGEGVIDRLRQLSPLRDRKVPIIEVNFGGSAANATLYRNKRTEMWFGIKEWLEAGGCIPKNKRLIQDLVLPTYHFDAANRHVLESKDDMKTRAGFSPDIGDALALTFAAPIRREADKRVKARTYDPRTYK
jgi:hypothetical protein